MRLDAGQQRAAASARVVAAQRGIGGGHQLRQLVMALELERACAQQVAALSGGRETVLIAPDAAQEETRNGPAKAMGGVSGLAWPGLKRKLDRELPGYDS
jgi:hypothetical protein